MTSLVAKFAKNYGVDASKMMQTLKDTAFSQGKDSKPISDEQMMALLIVADQYKLNPFTREIYAFPDKHKGIVPVVGIDGWSRIINSNEQFDGMEFNYSEDMVTPQGGQECHKWIECVIYRKDRTRPTVVREYIDEVYRKTSYPGPWQSHTKRFFRHKAIIQCARLAFGFVGIFDEDEAERIVEKDITNVSRATVQGRSTKPELAALPENIYKSSANNWKSDILKGRSTVESIKQLMLNRNYELTDLQLSELEACESKFKSNQEG